MIAQHKDLQRNILEFCRALRDRDLLVTPSEVIDALRTAEIIDLVDRTEIAIQEAGHELAKGRFITREADLEHLKPTRFKRARQQFKLRAFSRAVNSLECD